MDADEQDHKDTKIHGKVFHGPQLFGQANLQVTRGGIHMVMKAWLLVLVLVVHI